jgi:hypothetical protein
MVVACAPCTTVEGVTMDGANASFSELIAARRCASVTALLTPGLIGASVTALLNQLFASPANPCR